MSHVFSGVGLPQSLGEQTAGSKLLQQPPRVLSCSWPLIFSGYSGDARQHGLPPLHSANPPHSYIQQLARYLAVPPPLLLGAFHPCERFAIEVPSNPGQTNPESCTFGRGQIAAAKYP